MTPFCDKFFLTYCTSSIIFAVELVLIGHYYDSNDARSLIYIPMWWVLMFLSTYFTRNTLTQFFVMQMEAEKTRDALTQILDNLPDAVLMLESGHLSYCN